MKEFKAHSVILRARSHYFKSAFKAKWTTKKDNVIKFCKPNITPTVFDMILKYIYTGELNLTEKSGEDIFELLIASDELLIEELFNYVQDYLVEKRSEWIQKNIVLVLSFAFKIGQSNKLQDNCLEFIFKDSESFINSESFLSIDKDILYILLQRDELQIDEINLWNRLIKWGIEQTPGLGSENSDKSEWNDENYKALTKTLDQFFPLIRFVEISRTDFFDKVRPYKFIIPIHIYNEIEEFYYKDTLPKNLSSSVRIKFLEKIDSKIIDPKLANIISNWIDKKNPTIIRTENDSLYKFKLIYRGSHDDISNESFKRKCKGRLASLVLIKVKNTDKIFGGYSSIGFNSLGSGYLLNIDGIQFYNSLDNFIFSFENSKDIKNMKLSHILIHKNAIITNCKNVAFGFGRNSLYMEDKKLYVNNNSGDYENNLNTNTIYNIEEIETFVVIKYWKFWRKLQKFIKF
ncbi:hypothetical protein C1646_768392 [Rhizophagus diaphanus]|nr:hypothetical protein C1646_768392 [Rhizophagus diaphanus] [Rhizophagus sp. MUCL 43196]